MSTLTFVAGDLVPNFQVSDSQTTKKAITAIDLITRSIQGAFSDFLENKYENFDALVGENACQIRVSMVLDFCKDRVSQISAIARQVDEIRQKILSIKKQDIIPEKEMSFEDFCKTKNIFLEIPSEYLFLIEAWILCQSKDLNVFEKTKPENLQALLPGLSKKFSEDIVKSAQKSLSKRSVMYLQNLAQDVGFPLTSDFIFFDKKGIQGLPCFIGVEILLKHLAKEKYPILLRCTSNSDKSMKFVLFRSSEGSFSEDHIRVEPGCKLKDALKQKLLEPTFVVEGYCSQKVDVEKIKKFGFEIVLKANAAQHHQYFSDGKDKDPFEDKPDGDLVKQERAKYQKIAFDEGFSYENPTTFCIRHIFCQTLLRALEG